MSIVLELRSERARLISRMDALQDAIGACNGHVIRGELYELARRVNSLDNKLIGIAST